MFFCDFTVIFTLMFLTIPTMVGQNLPFLWIVAF